MAGRFPITMCAGIGDFLVSEKGEKFSSSEFRDAVRFRDFLNGNDLGGDAEPEFFARALDDIFLNLRFSAETAFGDATCEIRRRVKNSRGELPISWSRVVEILTEENKSPPSRLISLIAQQDFPKFRSVFDRMRMVLQREHAMQNAGSAQQLDSRSLLWLARRPGYSVAQKAGANQRILAVVRRKTSNTLENRVLKDFVHRAQLEAIRYLKDFEKDFKDSHRLREVARMKNFLHNVSQREIWKDVRSICGFPVPNYVLLHDRVYGIIWNLYQKILRQIHVKELAWGKRHLVFAELVRLWLFARLELALERRVFASEMWVDAKPTGSGFLRNTNFSNVFFCGSDIFEWRDAPPNACRFFKNGREVLNVVFAYLPKGTDAKRIFAQSDLGAQTSYIVYNAGVSDLPKNFAGGNFAEIRKIKEIDVAVSGVLSQILNA